MKRFILLLMLIASLSLASCSDTSTSDKENGSTSNDLIVFDCNGYYTAGVDFPAGEYKLEDNDGNNYIYRIYFDSNSIPIVDQISGALGTPELTTDVFSFNEGDILAISFSERSDSDVCKLSPANIYDNKLSKRENKAIAEIVLSEGNYKVGTTINPGVYDVFLEKQYYTDDEIQKSFDEYDIDSIYPVEFLSPDITLQYESWSNDDFSMVLTVASLVVEVYFNEDHYVKNVPLNYGDTFTIENCDIKFVPSK